LETESRGQSCPHRLCYPCPWPLSLPPFSSRGSSNFPAAGPVAQLETANLSWFLRSPAWPDELVWSPQEDPVFSAACRRGTLVGFSPLTFWAAPRNHIFHIYQPIREDEFPRGLGQSSCCVLTCSCHVSAQLQVLLPQPWPFGLGVSMQVSGL
jgi:hypothetical protein